MQTWSRTSQQPFRNTTLSTPVVVRPPNALLLYPDRPFFLGNFVGPIVMTEETERRERSLIAEPARLDGPG